MNNEFWDKLENLYKEKDGDIKAYKEEKPILEEVLEKIEKDKKFENIYSFEESIPIGRGGAGIVIKLKDRNLDLDRALKIPRPKDKEVIDSVKNEIKWLKEIRHENIISVYTLGEVKVEENIQGYKYSSYPYFVMDFIKGAKDLGEKLEDIIPESCTDFASTV